MNNLSLHETTPRAPFKALIIGLFVFFFSCYPVSKKLPLEDTPTTSSCLLLLLFHQCDDSIATAELSLGCLHASVGYAGLLRVPPLHLELAHFSETC